MRHAENVLNLLAGLGKLFDDPAAPFPEGDDLRGTIFEPLLFYFVRDEEKAKFHEAYRERFLFACEERFALDRLFALLEKENLPFVPVKGIDFAYHIYPELGLRAFGDWDIWVRPEDIGRFGDFLRRDGWTCETESFSDHHIGVRRKGSDFIEPHFSLPNFPGVPEAELWAETFPVPGKSMERRLSPELNLLMIFRHLLLDAGTWKNFLKALFDTEFLLRKTPPDWEKVSSLSVKWKIAHPGLLLQSFPEFFGKRYDCGVVFPDDEVDALRSLLLTCKEKQRHGGECNARSGKPFSPAWLKLHFQRLRKDNLRWRYPQIKESRAKYLFFLALDISRKTVILLKSVIFPSRDVTEKLRRNSCIERSWKAAAETRRRS